MAKMPKPEEMIASRASFPEKSWMDVKTEQRHRLPLRYARISPSDGLGFSRSSAMVFMTKPGLQKPHCSAPWSAMKPTNSDASSCRPSSVCTLRPLARAASVEHESTGSSSMSTVHKPQLEVSQPRFTLKQPCARTKSMRSVSAGTSSETMVPFSLILISITAPLSGPEARDA